LRIEVEDFRIEQLEADVRLRALAGGA